MIILLMKACIKVHFSVSMLRKYSTIFFFGCFFLLLKQQDGLIGFGLGLSGGLGNGNDGHAGGGDLGDGGGGHDGDGGG